jgi:uncharacterized membrane protein
MARVELWHPMVVHFPIALLLVGMALRLAAMAARADRLAFLLPAARLALALGTLGAWSAVYTGTLADAQVARTLCDPTVVERHENLAWWVASLFTAALLADGLLQALRARPGPSRLLGTLLAGTLLIASALLAYVGHLGASLVYQQAAAVHVPAQDCAAFE